MQVCGLLKPLPRDFCVVVCEPLSMLFSNLSTLAYRISYCTVDKLHDKVFAYIAQNTLNGTLECHAYLCSKRKVVSCFDHGINVSRRKVDFNFGWYPWYSFTLLPPPKECWFAPMTLYVPSCFYTSSCFLI